MLEILASSQLLCSVSQFEGMQLNLCRHVVFKRQY